MARCTKKAAKRRSAFQRWFIQQYGSMPDERKRVAALQKKRDAQSAMTAAQIEYLIEDEKFAAFTNALYGWNARMT